jgi:hypothetical protein
MNDSRNFISANKIKLPGIALEFSYHQDGSRLVDNKMDVVSVVGLVVGGISDARITLDSMKIA